jgi:mannose-1-phosphate guanylyltransferase
MNSHFHALILAGGRGTRFWPRSRRRSSKQVLNVVGSRSLIQSTVDRLTPVIPPERIWVLTNEHLREIVIAQLPEVPKSQILAEPAQRNTAPAIGLAAHILHSIDPDAVMGVFPSDHVIGKPVLYRKAVRAALKCAAAGNLVVVGIHPRWPEPGYGYLEFPRGTEPGLTAAAVRKFHEKPELAKAKRYLAAGNFYWNSGMFFWRADALLSQLREHLPKTASLLASLPGFKSRNFAARLKETFPLCENISIDYAVLERAKRVQGIPAGDFGWNDVGSWNAVYELLARDEGQNAAPPGTVFLDAHNNFVEAHGKMVALLGVENLVVVDTPDALLVTTRDQSHRVGEIVKALESQQRHDLL